MNLNAKRPSFVSVNKKPKLDRPSIEEIYRSFKEEEEKCPCSTCSFLKNEIKASHDWSKESSDEFVISSNSNSHHKLYFDVITKAAPKVEIPKPKLPLRASKLPMKY